MALAGSFPLGLLAIFALGATASEQSEHPSFEDYQAEHGLSYWGDQKVERQHLFNKAVEAVKKQNGNKGALWKAKVNKFAVLKEDEMQQYYGYMKTTDDKPSFGSAPRGLERDLPNNFDWRDRRPSVVTSVKNQGSCGSCWAFATSEVLESAVAIATGSLFELSPQQLTSCTPNPKQCGGSGGCTGATAQLAFNYTVEAGITSLWTWPYTSGLGWGNGDCFKMKGRKKPVAGITGYHQVPQNDAEALMRAVLVNPVAVSVAASNWRLYDTGIFDGCSTERPIINHAVVLMGYGEDDGNHYWLVRNSWGLSWGEVGYIRLQRFPGNEPCGEDDEPLDGYSCKNNAPKSIKACGMCGILSDSSYPTGAFLGAPQGPPDDPAIGASASDLAAAASAEAAGESVKRLFEQRDGGAAQGGEASPASSPAAPAAALSALLLLSLALGGLALARRRSAQVAEQSTPLYSEVAPVSGTANLA